MSLLIPELLRKPQLREVRWLKEAHTAGPCQRLNLHPSLQHPSSTPAALAEDRARTHISTRCCCESIPPVLPCSRSPHTWAFQRLSTFPKTDFPGFASVEWVTSLTGPLPGQAAKNSTDFMCSQVKGGDELGFSLPFFFYPSARWSCLGGWGGTTM